MLLSRSPGESHLYIELHPCGCGEFGFEWDEHRLVERGNDLLSVYSGDCAGCGRTRLFEFTLAPEPAPAPPAFGGELPSQIIDPGQFLGVSREAADSVPADPAELDGEEVQHAYEALVFAVESVEEVLKFIPTGADAVPPEAFHSDLGRELYQADADQFSRVRLAALRDSYLRTLHDYDRAVARAVGPPRDAVGAYRTTDAS